MLVIGGLAFATVCAMFSATGRPPARAAGLAAGAVIVRMNGVRISRPAEAKAVLSAPGSPRRMEMLVLRGGRVSLVPVELGRRPDFGRQVGVVLLILATVFTLLYLRRLDRVAVVGCGAVLAVVLGGLFGFYDQRGVFAAIRMSTLALLPGMGLITMALEETGFFASVARKVGELARGDWSRLMVLSCVTTFLLSALIDNLSTILVTLPVTLALAREPGFAPAPFVIAEIVSSNLGGASSMIGDFPNMLIASETGRQLHDFLLYMMPPWLVQRAITTRLMNSRRPEASGPRDPPPPPAERRLAALAAAPAAARRAPALAGGLVTLLLWNRAAPRLIARAGFGDVLFFAGLFVLVGCAESAGLLGVCAGSSAALSGATAGPVALTKVEQFQKRMRYGRGSGAPAELFLAGYAGVGVPLMFVFLAFSSAYICGLSVWS